MNGPEPLTADWLARHVDISCVRSAHGRADVSRLARSAIENRFVSAHVLPTWVRELRQLLDGSGVLAGAPIGFPSGGATSTTKVAEAGELLAAGAQELDVVIDIGRLKSGDLAYCGDELSRIVDVVDAAAPVRVIIEVSLLTDDEIARACDVAISSGADYVKTGTGWAGPTTLRHVELISEHVGDRIAIKAAGGIRSLDEVQQFRDLGVSRFGINEVTAIEMIRALRDEAVE